MSCMRHEGGGREGGGREYGGREEAESEHAFQSPEGKGEVLQHKKASFTSLIFRLIANVKISQSN